MLRAALRAPNRRLCMMRSRQGSRIHCGSLWRPPATEAKTTRSSRCCCTAVANGCCTIVANGCCTAVAKGCCARRCADALSYEAFALTVATGCCTHRLCALAAALTACALNVCICPSASGLSASGPSASARRHLARRHLPVGHSPPPRCSSSVSSRTQGAVSLRSTTT